MQSLSELLRSYGTDDPSVNAVVWDWYLTILVNVSKHGCDLQAAEIAARDLITAAWAHIVVLPHESWDRRRAWVSHFQSLLGQILDKQGRIDEARSAYDEAMRLDPELDEHVINFVGFLMNHGFFDDAVCQMHRIADLYCRDSDVKNLVERWCAAEPEFAERIRAALKRP